MYVGIKPLAIYLSALLLSDYLANLLATAILISTTLMASLSLGTYKQVLKASPGRKRVYYEMVRRTVFLINSAVLLLVCIISCSFFYWKDVVFVLLFVVNEHVIHDEVRLILYGGRVKQWAFENSVRTLFVLAIPLVVVIVPADHLTVLTILVTINVLYSVTQRGLFFNLNRSLFFIARSKIYIIYASQFGYFISSVASKFGQQSDRYVFLMLNAELLWLYSLISQIASIPLMAFEMAHMSRFKANIANIKKHQFGWLNNAQVGLMVGVCIASAALYALLGLQFANLFDSDFVVLFLLLLASTFIAATNMLNSEKLFWHLSSSSSYLKIDLRAAALGYLLVAPLVIYFHLLLCVRLPSLVYMFYKIWEAKKCLR